MPITIELPAEHPDVTALKEKVRKAAKEHSRRSHCGEYKTWLRDIGIDEGKKVKVEITFTAFGVETKAVKVFMEQDLAGKTHEEMNAWVAEQIAEKVTIAGAQITIPLTVTDLNVAVKATSGPGAVPDGHELRFTSREGRVAHIVSNFSITRTYGALCGTYPAINWSTTVSPRDEGRVCEPCQSRAANVSDDDDEDNDD